ncbi:hypothetical protein NDU88_002778 [Pleurodeles waltl]|uniref:Uncharacterized protein n=1 Tax=Pleurodeles waltl TaxID=8319 RepID=A0AAV7KUQ3_PLEWA|nr:hypothetical protein NDU88_002778 [Pleurodeles waltl]
MVVTPPTQMPNRPHRPRTRRRLQTARLKKKNTPPTSHGGPQGHRRGVRPANSTGERTVSYRHLAPALPIPSSACVHRCGRVPSLPRTETCSGRGTAPGKKRHALLRVSAAATNPDAQPKRECGGGTGGPPRKNKKKTKGNRAAEKLPHGEHPLPDCTGNERPQRALLKRGRHKGKCPPSPGTKKTNKQKTQ